MVLRNLLESVIHQADGTKEKSRSKATNAACAVTDNALDIAVLEDRMLFSAVPMVEAMPADAGAAEAVDMLVESTEQLAAAEAAAAVSDDSTADGPENAQQAERLELVEELWDSIADDDAALALTDDQREDLARRLAEADADPTGGAPWEEVRERIQRRSR